MPSPSLQVGRSQQHALSQGFGVHLTASELAALRGWNERLTEAPAACVTALIFALSEWDFVRYLAPRTSSEERVSVGFYAFFTSSLVVEGGVHQRGNGNREVV